MPAVWRFWVNPAGYGYRRRIAALRALDICTSRKVFGVHDYRVYAPDAA